MDQMAHTILRFDRFALDVTRGCLRENGNDIELRPKTFEVLRHLAENAGRLVPKSELFEAVWPHVTVSDDSLVQCVRELREKLKDSDRRLIKTVPRRGYLLDAGIAADPVPPPIVEQPQPAVGSDAPRFAIRFRRSHVVAALVVVAVCALAVALRLLGSWSAPESIALETSRHQTNAASRIPVVFKDCAACPEMIALPAGEFMMGSPAGELGRTNVEGAPRQVTIRRPFAIGRFEVTVGQFSTFVTETGLSVGNACRLIEKIDGETIVFSEPKASFRQPSYEATDLHPVGCISWHEAQAYVAWLRRRTGKPYRLPSEAEWEYAARAGTTTAFSFGDNDTQLCAYARFADLGTPFAWRSSCRNDTAVYGPFPVGTLKANPWGLFDMHGNVWEWVDDCWTANPSEMPTDGSAFTRAGDCAVGVLRGGSWGSGPMRIRSAMRWPLTVTRLYENTGFRVALALDNAEQ